MSLTDSFRETIAAAVATGHVHYNVGVHPQPRVNIAGTDMSVVDLEGLVDAFKGAKDVTGRKIFAAISHVNSRMNALMGRSLGSQTGEEADLEL